MKKSRTAKCFMCGKDVVDYGGIFKPQCSRCSLEQACKVHGLRVVTNKRENN